MRPTHVQDYIDAFEALTPQTLPTLENCFSEHARFVDPFNDVRGRDAIRQVFEHMFRNCENPRFRVDECIGDEGLFYLGWKFEFGTPGHRRRVDGASRIRFADDGLVTEHRDYWDPAGQLYEGLPVLGALFRAMRRRLSAKADTNPQTQMQPNRLPLRGNRT